MNHNLCSHLATSSARARCRRAGGPGAQPAPESSVTPDAPRRVRRSRSDVQIPHTDAERPQSLSEDDWHLLLRNRARFTQSPWPTDEERAAALADVVRRDLAAGRVVAETVYAANDLAMPDEVRYATDPIAERKIVAAREASQALPTFANARALARDIPEGRYAVRDASAGGEIKFYKIDKPGEGNRWAGYVFLKIQASDNEFPIKSAARQMSVYSQILEAGVAESSRLYGISLGSCGVCGRTLTDAESIAAGIGPVCASKMGW